ncbi:MAG: hypothetical protein A2036_03475 [Omnitrophica bacterium GWA2_50_21]|nr:MAG: hypothetical protein A2036_03475 [Omnitrophica bacterium GWA2_50_21]
MKFSKEFLERTVQVWQPYLKEPLSLDDAEEIANNAVGFYTFIAELDQKYSPSKNPAISNS